MAKAKAKKKAKAAQVQPFTNEQRAFVADLAAAEADRLRDAFLAEPAMEELPESWRRELERIWLDWIGRHRP